MNPLAPATGILVGLVLGLVSWAVIIGAYLAVR